MLSEHEIAELRERLERERDELRGAEQARRESGAVVELDQARTGRLSRMDALQGQAMAQAGERRARERLQRVLDALGRIEEDEFGLCVRCDREIAAARLRADPAAAICIHCAARAEDPGNHHRR